MRSRWWPTGDVIVRDNTGRVLELPLRLTRGLLSRMELVDSWCLISMHKLCKTCIASLLYQRGHSD